MSGEPQDDLAKTENDATEMKGNLSDDPEDTELSEKEKLLEERDRKLAANVTGRTRFTATVPSIGLFIASVVMAIGTFISLIITSYEFVIGEIDLHELTIEYVEYTDTFLLAVALYILSIGLTTLFVSENIPLPKWLSFHDFDDLKERLTSVIIVMIGVSFLGHVLKSSGGIETLWLGLGCAAVIIALSIFMHAVFKAEE